MVNVGDAIAAIAAVARRFGVERSTVRDWRDRVAAGELTPGKPGPRAIEVDDGR